MARKHHRSNKKKPSDENMLKQIGNFFDEHYGDNAPLRNRIVKRLLFIAICLAVLIPDLYNDQPHSYTVPVLLLTIYFLYLLFAIEVPDIIDHIKDHKQIGPGIFSRMLLFLNIHFGEDSALLNRVLKRLFFIAAGIIVALPIANETGLLRFIGLSLLFSGYHVLQFIIRDLREIMHYFAGRNENGARKFGSKRESRLTQFSAAIFLAGLISTVIGLSTLEHTLFGTSLFWLSTLVGFCSIITALTFYVRKSDVQYTGDYLFVLFISMTIGVSLLAGSLGLSLNRYIAQSQDKVVCVPVTGHEIGGRRNTKFYITVQLDKGTDRIRVTRNEFETANKRVCLHLERGLFGYDYVKKIMP
jgi:hypothetical protein